MRCALLALLLVLLVPGIARGAPLTNTAHLDYLGETVSPPAQAGHSTYGSEPLGVLWTYADRQADGSYKRIGGGAYDAGDEHVRAGRVQRRRHRPRRGRLHPPLAPDGLRRVTRARGRAAARPDVPAVAQRQRRAVDAAGRDAEPERRAGRAAGPVGLRPVVLAGAHGLGARRGPSRVQARRSRVRALPGRAAWTSRSPRSSATVLSQVRPRRRSSTASACRRG